jgi:hypothetical protein
MCCDRTTTDRRRCSDRVTRNTTAPSGSASIRFNRPIVSPFDTEHIQKITVRRAGINCDLTDG